MASDTTVRCAMCHLLTTVEEAMSRTFHQGKCGSCGGDLILHVLDTMPDAPVPAPMQSNGEQMRVVEQWVDAGETFIQDALSRPIFEEPTAPESANVGSPVGATPIEPEAPKSKRRRP